MGEDHVRQYIVERAGLMIGFLSWLVVEIVAVGGNREWATSD